MRKTKRRKSKAVEKTTKAQLKASKKYKNTKEGKKSQTKSRYKYSCKRYITDYADIEDIKELQKVIEQRLIELQSQAIENRSDRND